MQNLPTAIVAQCQRYILPILLFLFASNFLNAQNLIISTSHPDANFNVGETVQFKVKSNVSATLEYIITRGKYTDTLKSGTIQVSTGQTQYISYNATMPGGLLLTLKNSWLYGSGAAIVGAEDIKIFDSEPSDFLTFWQGVKNELQQVPMNPQVIPNGGNAYHNTYTVKLGNIDGRHVYGMLHVPKGSGPFPAIVELPAYGSGLVSGSHSFAERNNALILSISIHNAPVTTTDPNSYKPDNPADRDENYHKHSITAGIRAIDYLVSRSDFNGSDVAIIGESQGAGLGFLLAGIDNRVDIMAVASAAMGSHAGLLNGHASGFPAYLNIPIQAGDQSLIDATQHAVSYYEAATGAKYFKGKTLMLTSYDDAVCMAETQFAAINNLSGELIYIHNLDGGHNDRPQFTESQLKIFRRNFSNTDNPPFPWAAEDIGFQVSAGNDLSANVNTPVSLSATIKKELESNPSIAVSWRKISGPGEVTFSKPNAYSTNASFSMAGAYVLEFKGKDTEFLATDAMFYTLSDRVQVTVNGNGGCQNPVTVSAGEAQVVCGLQSVILNGSILGGTTNGLWSGGSGSFLSTNLLNTSYTPAVSEIGTTVSLTLTSEDPDGNGPCEMVSDIVNITFASLPVISAGSYPALCMGDAAISLIGDPIGGNFSGANVSGNMFMPLIVGTFTITYEYAGSNGCTNTATVDIVVEDCGSGCANPATVDAGADQDICSGSSIGLSGNFSGSATSATWHSNGTGIFLPNISDMNAVYSPSISDIANGTIMIILTSDNPDEAGCFAAKDTILVTIHELPIVSSGIYNTVCLGNSIPLQGTPLGGIYTGAFINGNTFNPQALGSFDIVYQYTDGFGCVNEATTNILVDDCCGNPAIVNAGPDQDICIGDMIQLDGSFSGNASVVTWTTSGTGSFSNTNTVNPIYQPSEADINLGHVTLTLTTNNPDGPCEAAVDVLLISFHTTPDLSAGIYDNICIFSPSVALIGSPEGGLFSGINVNNNTFNPQNLGTTTINYFYENEFGCSNTTSTTIIVENCCGNPATVDAGEDQTVCPNSTIQLDGNFGGSGSVTYWSTNGTGTFLPNIQTPNAVYVASQTDISVGSILIVLTSDDPMGPCTATSDTLQVAFATPPIVDAGTYQKMCKDDVTALSGSPAEGVFSGPFVNSNTNSFQPTQVGTFDVTYTYEDGNGCTTKSFSSIIVENCVCLNPAVVDAGAPIAICRNEAVHLQGTIGGGASSATWNGGSGTFSPNNQSLNATYQPSSSEIASGFVVLTLLTNDPDGSGFCDPASSSVQITIHDLPEVQAGNYNDICCENEALFLEGTPTGGTFSGPGVFNNKFLCSSVALGSHEITYQYVDNNGCSNTANTALVVKKTPSLVLTGGGELCCTVPTINIDISTDCTESSSFSWTGPDGSIGNTYPFPVTEPGTYNGVLTCANGCSNNAAMVVTECSQIGVIFLQVIPATGATINNGSAKVTVSGGTEPFTYVWTFNNEVVGSEQSITNMLPGTYNVLVTDANGCTISSEVIISNLTATEEPDWAFDIKVYPNPNTGIFNIELKDALPVEVELLNIYGQVVHQESLPYGKKVVQVKDVLAGMYYLKIISQGQFVLRKLYIEE